MTSTGSHFNNDMFSGQHQTANGFGSVQNSLLQSFSETRNLMSQFSIPNNAGGTNGAIDFPDFLAGIQQTGYLTQKVPAYVSSATTVPGGIPNSLFSESLQRNGTIPGFMMPFPNRAVTAFHPNFPMLQQNTNNNNTPSLHNNHFTNNILANIKPENLSAKLDPNTAYVILPKSDLSLSHTDENSKTNENKIENTELPCDVCGKKFTDAAKLRAHKYRHTKELSFKCDICSKGFNNEDKLMEHKELHDSDQAFSCSICNKVFHTKLHLERHVTTHNTDKPHKCDSCDKAFGRKEHLKRHQMTHTDERPFQCSMCDKAFRSKNNLITHSVRTGHTPKLPMKSNGKKNEKKNKDKAQSPKNNSSSYPVPIIQPQPLQLQNMPQITQPTPPSMHQIQLSAFNQNPQINHQLNNTQTMEQKPVQSNQIANNQEQNQPGMFQNQPPRPVQQSLQNHLQIPHNQMGSMLHILSGNPQLGHQMMHNIPQQQPFMSNTTQHNISLVQQPPQVEQNQTHITQNQQPGGQRTPNLTPQAGEQAQNLTSNPGQQTQNLTPHTGQQTQNLMSNTGKQHKNLTAYGGQQTVNLSTRTVQELKSLMPNIGQETQNMSAYGGQQAPNLTPNAGQKAPNFKPNTGQQTSNLTPHIDTEFNQEGPEDMDDLSPHSQGDEQSVSSAKKKTGRRPRKDSLAGKVRKPRQPNVCRLCGETFVAKASFNTHLLEHSGRKPYQCDQCDKIFNDKSSLSRHQMTHSGEKPYQCSHCDKTFSRRDHLQRHVLTHTGEKPYQCHCCPEWFKLKRDLNAHLESEHGEKPLSIKRVCTERKDKDGGVKTPNSQSSSDRSYMSPNSAATPGPPQPVPMNASQSTSQAPPPPGLPQVSGFIPNSLPISFPVAGFPVGGQPPPQGAPFLLNNFQAGNNPLNQLFSQINAQQSQSNRIGQASAVNQISRANQLPASTLMGLPIRPVASLNMPFALQAANTSIAPGFPNFHPPSSHVSSTHSHHAPISFFNSNANIPGAPFNIPISSAMTSQNNLGAFGFPATQIPTSLPVSYASSFVPNLFPSMKSERGLVASTALGFPQVSSVSGNRASNAPVSISTGGVEQGATATGVFSNTNANGNPFGMGTPQKHNTDGDLYELGQGYGGEQSAATGDREDANMDHSSLISNAMMTIANCQMSP